MNLIRFLMHRSWPLLLLSLAAGLVSGAAGAASIAVIHEAMQEHAPFWTMAWSFLVLAVLFATTKALSEIVLTRLGQSTISELRLHVSRRILAAPLRHIQHLGPHRLLAALNEDTDVIAQAYVQTPLILINGTTTIGCLVYLGWLSWPLLGLVVAIMLLGGLSFVFQERRALGLFEQARETNDTLFRHVRSILEGIKELKQHRARRHAFLTTQLEPTVRAYERDFVAGMTVYSIASNWGLFLFYLALGTVLFLYPAWHEVPLETVVGATLVLLYMMGPFSQIVELLPSVGRANVALRKLEALGLSLASSAETEHEAEATTSTAGQEFCTWQRIELQDVTHRYVQESGDHDFRVGPIDLTFRPGEVTFLIGGNGSGKTTLALVLLGLYPPETGTIRVDGLPIDASNREAYRQLFSTVFSDFSLFESLLGLGTEGLDAAAQSYVERLQLASKVRIEQGRLSTVHLSQGQRKRLALVTAYLEDRPFYVFDEWAADQDPLFRRVFYTEVLPGLKARGKAVLVITHDDQYFPVADRCIRMDFGRIVDISDRAMAEDGEPVAASHRTRSRVESIH